MAPVQVFEVGPALAQINVKPERYEVMSWYFCTRR